MREEIFIKQGDDFLEVAVGTPNGRAVLTLEKSGSPSIRCQVGGIIRQLMENFLKEEVHGINETSAAEPWAPPTLGRRL